MKLYTSQRKNSKNIFTLKFIIEMRYFNKSFKNKSMQNYDLWQIKNGPPFL